MNNHISNVKFLEIYWCKEQIFRANKQVTNCMNFIYSWPFLTYLSQFVFDRSRTIAFSVLADLIWKCVYGSLKILWLVCENLEEIIFCIFYNWFTLQLKKSYDVYLRMMIQHLQLIGSRRQEDLRWIYMRF